MLNQTIEDIITEINIERLKSKETEKITQNTEMTQEKSCTSNQQS